MQADAQGLRFPIVENVEFGELPKRGSVAARIEAQFDARADHLFPRHTISVLDERAHEVRAACRHDVSLEAVLP